MPETAQKEAPQAQPTPTPPSQTNEEQAAQETDPLQEEAQGPVAVPFGADKPKRDRTRVQENDDFDPDEVEETYGVAWTQNVRLVIAIIVVIVSAAFIWWFVW